MSPSKKLQEEKSAELREAIKRYEGEVVTFSYYLLGTDNGMESILVDIFRDFGAEFIRNRKPDIHPEAPRIALFRIAWDHIRDFLDVHRTLIPAGRDTRNHKEWETNLLASPSAQVGSGIFLDRLRRVDPELRVAVVLKDILKFDDEVSLRILNLRWGVFRHRLHRGRLEFAELLKGKDAELRPEAGA